VTIRSRSSVPISAAPKSLLQDSGSADRRDALCELQCYLSATMDAILEIH
jgi:hypothetical protein